jgi:hypothetical protein
MTFLAPATKVEVRFSELEYWEGLRLAQIRAKQLFPDVHRRRRTATRILSVSGSVILLWIAPGLAAHPSTETLGTLALLLALLVLGPGITSGLYRWFYRPLSGGLPMASRTYAVTAAGLRVESELGSGTCPWPSIRTVELFRGFVLIFFSAMLVLAIGESQFATPRDAAAFVAEIQQRMDAGSQGPDHPASPWSPRP